MRTVFLFALSVCVTILSGPAVSAVPVWEETRTLLFEPEKGSAALLVHPGEAVRQTAVFRLRNIPAHRFLRVVGGVKQPAPFERRGESLFRDAEFLIDDNLDSICTGKDRYSLYFKGDDDNFERLAFQRIPGDRLHAGEWVVTLPVVRKENLEVDKKGYFGLQLGLYYKKAGRAASDIYDEPDSLLSIPVPAGSGRAEKLTHKFILPEGVACVFLQLGGIHFSGECWVEAPRFFQNRKEVCRMPFLKYEQRTDRINYWAGCNLSTRSWPKWKLEADGKTVFEGNIFDRASNVADFYIALPEWVKDTSRLELHLLKEDHRAAYPYELRRLELIEEPARDYEVVAVPRYVACQAAFGILVETNRPGVKLRVTAEGGGASPALQECRFDTPGLHVVEMRAGKPGLPVLLSFDDGGRKETAQVDQVIAKNPERIYISSGDEIYIDKVYGLYDYFFKWYMNRRVGNWYQFRPSYQWSGFRVSDPGFTGHYIRLLDRLKVPYAWQVEGRTLAGSRLNPSLEVLASPMFRGKQAHENDGGYYYWTHFKYEGLVSDLAARARPYGGIFAKHRPIVTDHGTFIHYDPEGVKSMAEGARNFVGNLRSSKGESSRHTGPSTLFRYFYQAGYNWVGAEQMYGPEETVLSALRGASRAYMHPEYGSLHAMQWSSGPFTDPRHSLRLYMSLALAYMHGSSHMNTEEALWTDEYSNDRYSQSGKEHLFAQHQVLDYIETHARRGELKSNTAIIQGRNDSWKVFVRGNIWSQKSDLWKFDQANESFDLLHVFYPHNHINACGPDGWFTDTPYGTVDLLPIEAPLEVMNRYRTMIFLGWNSFETSDFERIRDYVHQGGTLVLTAAHINEAGLPNTPVRFPENDEAVRDLLGEGYRLLTEKTEIISGNGKIIYFPQPVYPADSLIRREYEAVMYGIARKTSADEAETGWITGNPAVGFTVWDDGDRRTIYLLNTDWKGEGRQGVRTEKLGNEPYLSGYISPEEEDHEVLPGGQPAVLVYGSGRFPIQVRRYHLETIHCRDGLAVLPASNTTDILQIERGEKGWRLQVQTTGPDVLRCMQKISGKDTVLTVEKAGICELPLPE